MPGSSRQRRPVDRGVKMTGTVLKPLSESQFEVIRDFVMIMSRRMSRPQVLEITSDLHLLLRRREHKGWDAAREGAAGFQ
jgi:hypothetical protein